MRSEAEMFDIILKVAKENAAVKVVTLTGSRTNPNVAKDRFQDYDIAYYVTALEPFKTSDAWLDVFGEQLISQRNEDMLFDPSPPFEGLIYLMQFTDGNRIDLSIRPLEKLRDDLREDSLNTIVLDKEGMVKEKIVPSEQSYYVQTPSEALYQSCINECYFVSLYVDKGIKRDEIPYALKHLGIIRNCLEGMLNWYIGAKHQFTVSVGKCGKYYQHYLPESWNERYLDTYASRMPDKIKQALFILLELFHEVAILVALELEFVYDETLHSKIVDFLKQR